MRCRLCVLLLGLVACWLPALLAVERLGHVNTRLNLESRRVSSKIMQMSESVNSLYCRVRL